MEDTFPSVDLFNEDNRHSKKVNAAEKDRVNYVARRCSLEQKDQEFLSQGDNGKKMLADKYYWEKDYDKARKLYQSLVDKQGGKSSLALKRDFLECLARSCLALGDTSAALYHANQLLESCPVHPDHQTVTLSLLLTIRLKHKDYGSETRDLLVKMITNQPGVAKFWAILADCYFEDCLKRFHCLVRAKELLGVYKLDQCGLGKSRENRLLEELEAKIKNEEIDRKEEIMNRIYRDIRNQGIEEKADGSEEFQDLGASVRLNRVEQELSNVGDLNLDSLTLFEQRWFLP